MQCIITVKNLIKLPHYDESKKGSRTRIQLELDKIPSFILAVFVEGYLRNFPMNFGYN